MSTVKTSLFAKRMKLQKSQNLKTNMQSKVSHESLGEASYILTGPEANTIHQENAQRLSEMTQQDILEEQKKLISELDPGLIEFLRSRRSAHKKDVIVPVNMDTTSTSAQDNEKESKEIKECEDVRELKNKYPHMDIVEEEKLSWIGELPEAKPPPPDKPYQARFDFEGNLLPYVDDGKGVLLGLHSHGEEQERPGYTIQELIHLSRASVTKQRIIALNTLANIMAKAFSYQMCFEEPLIPQLLDAEMYLLLRFSLDDESKAVVMASCVTLCNLLVNHFDEVCLDCMLGTPFGIQQPSLGVVIEMKPDDVVELKDTELLKLDLIRGALRTDLLTRLKYILECLHPEPVEIKHILKILIRIVRHSYDSAEAVFTFPKLLLLCRTLLDNSINNSYFPESLKLFRIIAARSRSFAIDIIEKYSIMQPILKFITGGIKEQHPELMHLTLESFYTWQTLLAYNLTFEQIGEVIGILCKLCQVHLSVSSLEEAPTSDLEHATALLTTVLSITKLPNSSSLTLHLLPLVFTCSSMWVTRFSKLNYHSLPICKLLGAVLRFASVNQSFIKDSVDLNLLVESLLSTKSVFSALQFLKKSSWLLQGECGSSPENLPCLGSIPPHLAEFSCMPFIFSFASFILASKNKHLMKKLVTHEAIVSYIENILLKDDINKLCTHWFARQELILLVTLTSIYTDIEDDTYQEMYHNLAFLLVSSVQSGDKHFLPHIMSNAVFKKKFFMQDVETITNKINELSMKRNRSRISWSVKKRLIEKSISELDKIEDYYSKELGLFGVVPHLPLVTLTGQLNSTEAALPSDWPFLPILRMYNTDRLTDNDLQETVLSLQWILLLEELKPAVAKSSNVTARYCRMCCFFLAGNNFFSGVTDLLEVTLERLLLHSKKLNFDESVPGLSSFYDFYRQLLEQFSAVSYCDPVFGQFVLVPLQQRHSAKYKKLVWSEMAVVLRFLSTPTEQVNMDDYLYPYETDPDILVCYLHAVGTGRVREEWSPVLYRVAIHHVSTYIRNHNDRPSRILTDRINKLGNQELRELFKTYNT